MIRRVKISRCILALWPAVIGCQGLVTRPDGDLEPSADDSAELASPVYDARFRTITIDGALTDWIDLPTVTFAENSGRGSRDNQVTAALAWDDSYLYASYRVTDTELAATQTTRDGDVYHDDAVELFVDTRRDGGTAMKTDDYQLLVSARNVVEDLRGTGKGKDVAWNCTGLRSAVKLRGTLNDGLADGGYDVELAIPWASIGVSSPASRVVGIDLAMDDRDPQGSHQTADWAGLTKYAVPSGWRGVTLVPPAPPAPPSHYDAAYVASAPVIDGALGEWSSIAPLALATYTAS
jgi:hypothetical protein